MRIQDLKTVKSTQTPLISVRSLQLVRNFANPYLITRTHDICVYVKTDLHIWESVLKILISLKMIQSLSSKSNNVLILLEERKFKLEMFAVINIYESLINIQNDSY